MAIFEWRMPAGLLIVLFSAVSAYTMQKRENQALREQMAGLAASVQAQANAPPTHTIERVIVREAAQTAMPVPMLAPSGSSSPNNAVPTPNADKTQDEVREAIAQRFDEDPVDRSAAATQALSTIATAVQARHGDGVALKSLECRTSLCKLELDLKSHEADRSVMDALFRGEQAIRVGGVIIPERIVRPDGHVEAKVYIARGTDIVVND